jgi:anthranilate/para-aminobenzoate synthase component II
MKEDVIIIDFLDSFTYNIAAEVGKIGFDLKVFENSISVFKKLEKIKEKKVLILGPGPGHPDEYQKVFPIIKRLLKKKNLFFLGICLGHQILWRIQGEQVVKSKKPIHGMAVPFIIPPWEDIFKKRNWGMETMVQRYNSLTVKPSRRNKNNFSFSGGEVMAGRFERGLTYQFHPESIGTDNPYLFFEPLKKILTK